MALAMDGGTSDGGGQQACFWERTWFSRLTRSEAALVDPGVHICALILKLLEVIVVVLEFVLEVFNLILIGSDGIIEGLGQWVGCGFHVGRSDGTGVCVDRGYRASARSCIISLVASSGGSKGLQFVLRVETAGVLGVFIWWALN